MCTHKICFALLTWHNSHVTQAVTVPPIRLDRSQWSVIRSPCLFDSRQSTLSVIYHGAMGNGCQKIWHTWRFLERTCCYGYARKGWVWLYFVIIGALYKIRIYNECQNGSYQFNSRRFVSHCSSMWYVK